MEHERQRHAFIVDDDPQVRSFVSKVLTNAGFTSCSCSGLAEVEAALTQAKPDLIVLDLALGGSDAVEVMRSLAASLSTGRVLLISGKHDGATLEQVHKIGKRQGLSMLPFLRKPFRVEELRARIAPEPVPIEGASEPDLANALRNNWLELWYQPKIDLQTMLICGAEALVRLNHPVHGIASPGAFLPPAGNALYRPLTDFIARRALSDWMTFASRQITIPLAINVPASVLQERDFISGLRRHLPNHPKFPGLIVEITEDEAIADLELAREVAVQLRLYNIYVAIDDFGIGHSTMERLNELPFVELKLDRSYVSGCSSDAHKRAICHSVVSLARRSGVRTVAEGIEAAADLKTLKEMGYHAGQGFIFAKPMPRDEFVELLLQRAVQKVS